MPPNDPAKDVTGLRLEGVESSIDGLRVEVSEMRRDLRDLVRLQEQHIATVDAVRRAHTRIDALDKDSEDCTKRTAALERSVESHTWALRLVTAAILTGVVAIVVAALK